MKFLGDVVRTFMVTLSYEVGLCFFTYYSRHSFTYKKKWTANNFQKSREIKLKR